MKILPGFIKPQPGKRPFVMVELRLRDLISEFAYETRAGDILPNPTNRGGTAKGTAVINKSHVAKIMASFNPAARDGITLAQQEDGETYIVTDGHHFLTAALSLQEAGTLLPVHAESMVKIRIVPEVDRYYWYQLIHNQLRMSAKMKIKSPENPLNQRLTPVFRPVASRMGIEGTKGLISSLGQIVSDFLIVQDEEHIDIAALGRARKETDRLLDVPDINAIATVPRTVKAGLNFFAEVGHELNQRFPKGKAPKTISVNAGIMTILLTDSTNGCTISSKYPAKKIAASLASPRGRSRSATHRDVELAANTVTRRNVGDTQAYTTMLYMGITKPDAWDFVQSHFPREAKRILASKIESRDLP